MTCADVFTEEVMTRPRFEEPTCKHVSEGDWPELHEFALGRLMPAATASQGRIAMARKGRS